MRNSPRPNHYCLDFHEPERQVGRHPNRVSPDWSPRGYLDQPTGRRLRELLEEAEVPLFHHHTSGHASVKDLTRLVDAFAPARVVPIHSEAADQFTEYFPRVERHADGEWWGV